jgi:lipopolysaccharide transport system ATP-binding protein
MSFDLETSPTEPVIVARSLGKSYRLFESPGDRLKQLLWGRWKQYSREFQALNDVNFEIYRGEVVGLIGRNGAGKSTLLQMVCGTLMPSSGSLEVRGRVAALLELGAGFSPDFSGLENVYMNAAILGLSRSEVDAKLDDILAFADIGDFIRQPVKTYSSGMFMRLAFSVATSVEPDILVIDEALSVGDGAFARKSFDRIMALKDRGATILFCSHAMYHVQALCSRAIWMENGKARMIDSAAHVTSAYETSLVMETTDHHQSVSSAVVSSGEVPDSLDVAVDIAARIVPSGTAVLSRVEAFADGVSGRELAIHSGRTSLLLRVHFASDPELPCPSVAVGFAHANGMVVSSAGSANDGVVLKRDAAGFGFVELTFERLPLLKGDYTVSVILGCERGLHVYEVMERVIQLRVVQQDLEQGLVKMPHRWTIE